MTKTRIFALLFLALGVLFGYFIYTSEVNPESEYGFRLGLDLQGGTHLVYRADVSNVDPTEVDDAMQALRDVIERRTNLFGVSEPIVQVERGSFVGGSSEEYRLIVELPGITDVDEAIALIGQTPLLEFKLENREVAINLGKNAYVDENGILSVDQSVLDTAYVTTGLTGRYVKRASLQFDGTTGEPVVHISFNAEGADLFEEITKAHVGEVLAIFLDGQPISTPTIQTRISGGTAVITGTFTPTEARTLARDLNYGALPLPIHLEGTQSIGASLGENALNRGVYAGIWGLLFVSVFLVLWYRLPGLIAVCSLGVYIVIMLTLFKVIPVTLTAAGLAGFVLSVGMAVDANVLIFERIRDELRHKERDIATAVKEGFIRAWLPIRDGNISSILTAVVLFWFGTSLVEGFALVFGLGVLVSMLTAISVSRFFLMSLGVASRSNVSEFLFGSGIKK